MITPDPHPTWVIPVLVALLGVLVLTHRRRSRPVVVVYEPPATIAPAEAGVLVDGRLDVDDFVAGIVDLAVRGYLTLTRIPHALAGDDVLITVARPWQADPGVRSFEITILARMYERGAAARRLSDVRADRRDLDALANVVAAELASAGLFLLPPAAAERAGRWLAVIVTAVWSQLALNADAPAQAYAAGLVTGGLLWMLARLAPRRLLSRAGHDARQQILGFREFLRRAEKDRIEQMPADTLHALLAWAIALGVTDAWVGRFVGRPVPSPTWLIPRAEAPAALAAEVRRMRTIARRRR